jgi:hypothetical protein
MQLPKKIGTAPDNFRVTSNNNFTGLEFAQNFPEQTPVAIFRISIIYNNPGVTATVTIVFHDLANSNLRIIHKSESSSGSYSWDFLPIIVGPGQFLGIETTGLTGGGTLEIVASSIQGK